MCKNNEEGEAVMNVAYHCSDSYAPVLGTSIASLLVNNMGMDEIQIFVIENNISSKNKKKLKQLVQKYNRRIEFIQMPDINTEQNLGLKKVRKDWIFDSYCRLFLGQLLPKDIHKVLYLDSDSLVTGDLKELWNTELTEYCVAGVKDCLGKKYYELLGLKESSSYCNSGVMLQNLDSWRNENISNRIREYVYKNGGYVFFMEQSVYNAVFQGEIMILPPKYNTYTLMHYLEYDDIIRLRKPKDFYTEQEIKEAIEDSRIVHLTSSFLIINRAWYENTNHPLKELYKKYKDLTPWKNELGFDDRRSIKTRIIHLIIKYLPQRLVIVLSEIIYNSLRIYNIKRIQKKCKRQSSLNNFQYEELSW